MRHSVLAAVVAATLPAAAAAEIVKLVDPSGRVIYADRPVKGARVVGTVDADPPVASAKSVPKAETPPKPESEAKTESKTDAPKPDAAKSVAPKEETAKVDAPKAATPKAATSARNEIRWSGGNPTGPRTMNAAYTELEASTTARDTAERDLREAIVPRAGETVRLADGNVRYLPVYYERIAPYERAAMLAHDRHDRAQQGFRGAR